MTKRKSTGKRLRFAIFARDNFTCRYCGRQSDTVVLQIDHLIPICQGGTNDESNLVTACFDCNAGKSGFKLSQAVPNETDRLRMAQELHEQTQAAGRARKLVNVRIRRRKAFTSFLCKMTGNNTFHGATAHVLFSYVERYGEEVVYPWIEKAAAVCYNDQSIGKYVSGIRRSVEKGEE